MWHLHLDSLSPRRPNRMRVLVNDLFPGQKPISKNQLSFRIKKETLKQYQFAPLWCAKGDPGLSTPGFIRLELEGSDVPRDFDVRWKNWNSEGTKGLRRRVKNSDLRGCRIDKFVSMTGMNSNVRGRIRIKIRTSKRELRNLGRPGDPRGQKLRLRRLVK